MLLLLHFLPLYFLAAYAAATFACLAFVYAVVSPCCIVRLAAFGLGSLELLFDSFGLGSFGQFFSFFEPRPKSCDL